MNSLSNPWIAGIAAGIISGIIVAWISHFFLARFVARRDGPGAAERTDLANQEILKAVRQSVTEGQIPRRDVIAAFTRATARRYGLPASSLFQPVELAEELIKDVMESNSLSAAKKSDLCTQLSYLLLVLPPTESSESQPEIPELRKRVVAHRGQAETHTVSALTGVLAGVLSGVFAGHELLGKYLATIPHGLRIGLEALAGIAAALVVLLIIGLIFHRDLRRQLEEEDRAAPTALNR